MKYIVGMDEFFFVGSVDPDKMPVEIKHVWDGNPPRVMGSPKRELSNQFAEASLVCLEFPKECIRDHEDWKRTPRHVAMTGWEARNMAAMLVAAADASDRSESFDSEVSPSCKCDIQTLAQGGPHSAGCSKV